MDHGAPPDSPNSPLNEQDPRLPSGSWTGYFRQGVAQARQRMNLTFKEGHATGTGGDFVGTFSIEGSYDTTTARVSLIKTYATHIVSYEGLATQDGIPGTWTILNRGNFRQIGDFHIWPDLLTDQKSLHVEATLSA